MAKIEGRLLMIEFLLSKVSSQVKKKTIISHLNTPTLKICICSRTRDYASEQRLVDHFTAIQSFIKKIHAINKRSLRSTLIEKIIVTVIDKTNCQNGCDILAIDR